MAFFLLFVLGLCPFITNAKQQPGVVINEIAWMGTVAQGVDVKQEWRHEWLELLNVKNIPLQLDAWSIELYRKEELYFQIPLSGTIVSEGYFLIGASDKIPGVDVNYANLGGKFVNSGMRVLLKDNLGNVVDEVDASEGWPAGDNKSKRTMERIAGPDPVGWQSSAEPGGTPKAENSTGFQEVNFRKDIFLASKKPFAGSLYKESVNVFSSRFPLALVLALLSAGGVLGLRRFLDRLS